MNDLYDELQVLMKDLKVSIKMLRKNGIAYAEAERDYKVLLCQKCLKLRDSGMAVGLIELTCRGFDDVAEARLKRDAAKVVYNANQEAINGIKKQMNIISDQISREWGAT